MAQPGNTRSQSIALLDLFLNPVIFDNLIKYLPLQSISHLSRVDHGFHTFIFETPKVFRYLDLSRSRKAFVSPELVKIDRGANVWRSERMDENLTEDEFYAGPLRGVFSTLRRINVLKDVQVLILDELSSVTTELVVELATREDLNVKILSVRSCVNINDSQLRSFLKYLCRPGRPDGAPRLQGLYYFTDPRSSNVLQKSSHRREGVMVTDGATLGTLPVDKSRSNPGHNPWYAPTGQIISTGYRDRTPWEETLMICAGIIVFDAVLCRHMHDAMSNCLNDASIDFLTANKPGIPTMATIALGPEGCSGCGRAPHGSPVWGQSSMFEFPLLWPPPQTGNIVDAVRPPLEVSEDLATFRRRTYRRQRLIVSCKWCLENRHCDSCHRWWCADCYNPKKSARLSDLESLSSTRSNGVLPPRDGADLWSVAGEKEGSATGDSVKVFNGLCIEDCLVGEMMSGAGSFGMWA